MNELSGLLKESCWILLKDYSHQTTGWIVFIFGYYIRGLGIKRIQFAMPRSVDSVGFTSTFEQQIGMETLSLLKLRINYLISQRMNEESYGSDNHLLCILVFSLVPFSSSCSTCLTLASSYR